MAATSERWWCGRARCGVAGGGGGCPTHGEALLPSAAAALGVERTFGWFSRYRCLNRDDERPAQTGETTLYRPEFTLAPSPHHSFMTSQNGSQVKLDAVDQPVCRRHKVNKPSDSGPLMNASKAIESAL